MPEITHRTWTWSWVNKGHSSTEPLIHRLGLCLCLICTYVPIRLICTYVHTDRVNSVGQCHHDHRPAIYSAISWWKGCVDIWCRHGWAKLATGDNAQLNSNDAGKEVTSEHQFQGLILATSSAKFVLPASIKWWQREIRFDKCQWNIK